MCKQNSFAVSTTNQPPWSQRLLQMLHWGPGKQRTQKTERTTCNVKNPWDMERCSIKENVSAQSQKCLQTMDRIRCKHFAFHENPAIPFCTP